MDNLTNDSLFVIALSCYATVLLILANGQTLAKEEEKRSLAVRQHVVTPELDSKIQAAKNLLSQENLEKARRWSPPFSANFPMRASCTC